MITDAIKQFPQQLEFEPFIKNSVRLSRVESFIVAGMGGSRLAADLLKRWDPFLRITVHDNYGLPALSYKELAKALIIASSYSGNTEEVLDTFEQAIAQKLPMAAISMGGELLKKAAAHGVPYVELPDWGIQPQSAVGLSIVALLSLMQKRNALTELKQLSNILDPGVFEQDGRRLAEELKGFVPIIYSSKINLPIAYNWKIRFNETGKIPAFYNVFPELNHNEIMGFDFIPSTTSLSERFSFLFMEDDEDHPKIALRMELLKELYNDRKLPVTVCEIKGKNAWEKIFSSLILADWTAYYTAKQYNIDSEQIDFVEEFKKRLSIMAGQRRRRNK